MECVWNAGCASQVVVAIVALLHLGFMLAEMLAWPWLVRKVTGLPREVGEVTRGIGFNQGLYNGFLAAGLAYSLVAIMGNEARLTLQIFLLSCVFLAGIGATWSLGRTGLLFLQSLPALVGLVPLIVLVVSGGTL